jgi:Domain of unknown function (DUF4123)
LKEVMNVEKTTEGLVELIEEHLFSSDGMNVFAVLDGASVPALLDKLYDLSPEFCCLFKGELSPDMAEVAPYVVRIERDSEFSNWLIGEGWGKHWGIYALADADVRAIVRHLRTLLIVFDDNGRPLRFRYYDPRVLAAYLRTCNPEELAVFFGPIDSYFLEARDKSAALRFQWSIGSLRENTIAIDDLDR